MSRFSVRATLALLICTLAIPSTRAHAQIPFDACIDRAGTPVRGIIRDDMTWGGVATVEKGEPIIYWNQRSMGRRSRTTQIFVYLHECGHHTLGHIWKSNGARWEQEADCWAVQLMWEGGMIAGRHLRVLEEELSRTRGDATHLGGKKLLEALQRCLAIKTDRRAWSAALAELIEAGADSFASIRGQAVPTLASRSGIHESLADLPGTYDCEVTEAREVRCMIFAAREGGRIAGRFDDLARIIPAALPAPWASQVSVEPPAGAVRELVARDSAAGLEISLVATSTHRIVFTIGLLATADSTPAEPMLPPDPIAFRAEPEPQAGPSADAPRERGPFVLHQGVAVRIRVPALGTDWVRARAARTASATPCILFALDIETPDGQKRYAMLRGVTAIEVDGRMWDGPVLNLPAEGADWTPVSLEGVKRQDAGCRR